MAFVERVMHWGDDQQDTSPPAFEPTIRRLAVHDVYAASMEMAVGRLTVAQFKAAINSTPEDNVDIDALVASIPSVAATRAIRIHEIHAIFILAERRFQSYNTPALIRTKLGI